MPPSFATFQQTGWPVLESGKLSWSPVIRPGPGRDRKASLEVKGDEF